MAWSTVSTEIQNPARGKAKSMTAKQIRYFGTKRQKAALKAKRSKARHHHSSAKHRARTNPPKTKKRAKARHTTRKTKRKSSHRPRTVKRNPELVSFLLGNPAKRRSKGMAHKHKKRAKARHSKNAGTRRRTRVTRHTRRRGNPAGIPLKDFAYGGVGALGGFVGSAWLPQLILGSGNVGWTGYGVTALAAIGLTILTHMIFPRQRAITFGVAAGGGANLLRRIITDQTPFGSYVAGAGMGDYMVANWGPPLMTNGLHSAMAAPYGTGVPAIQSSGVSMTDMADIGGGYHRPC
jgi:hypothetical protein